MIHYHGTPIGGNNTDAIRFLNARHALVSFQYRSQLAPVLEAASSFVFDNGAFTVWKSGGTLDRDGYYKWVEDHNKHPGFDWALIPDIIDGTPEENDKMLEDWPKHLRGTPVYHIHEPIERLQHLAAEYDVVALGSSGDYPTPNAKVWWGRMAEIMDAVCDEYGRPPCKLHGLRMLNPVVFTKLPLASADSVNAGINNGTKLWQGKFGGYTPISPWQRSAIIADRIETYNSAQCWGGKGFVMADVGGEEMECW